MADVLPAFVDAARAVGAFDAAYVLGSLAHGGFAPLVSDVDVMLVLDGEPDVDAITALVHAEAPGPLAERLSVFWASWDQVRSGVGPGRLPPADRLDLIDHGRLLAGVDLRAGATRPSSDDLVAGAAEFLLGRVDVAALRDVAGLVAGGPRPVTKAALFPARLLHTLRTGRLGRNDEAIAGYDGPAAPLVAAAGRWRVEGLDDTAPALLAAHLVPAYEEVLSAYVPSAPALADLLAALRR